MTLIPARRRRQTLLIIFLLAVFSYIAYTRSNFLTFSAPDHENHTHPPPSPKLRTPEHLPASYGTARRPPFRDLILLSDLPEKHIIPQPGSGVDASERQGKRLIFIGDVHGMLGPLKELLGKVGFDASAGDHVVFTGDLVMKGPDSVGVVDYAMEIGASGVRGNHEDRVLLAAQQLDMDRRRRKHRHDAKKQQGAKAAAAEIKKRGPIADEDTEGVEDGGEEDEDHQYSLTDPMEEEHFSHGDAKDRTIARLLSTHQLTYLASLPVILRLPNFAITSAPPSASSDSSASWPALSDLVVVHAGLVPGPIPLPNQDPWAAMNMRTLLYPGQEVRLEFSRQAIEAARREAEPDPKRAKKINVKAEESEVIDLAFRDHRKHDNALFIPVASRDGEKWAGVYDKSLRHVEEKLLSLDSAAIAAAARNDEGDDKIEEEKTTSEKEAEATATEKDRLISVIFGHDSKSGIQMGEYTYGIDTGCVRGGKLTAFVVEPAKGGKEGEMNTSIVSVECKSAGMSAENEDDF